MEHLVNQRNYSPRSLLLLIPPWGHNPSHSTINTKVHWYSRRSFETHPNTSLYSLYSHVSNIKVKNRKHIQINKCQRPMEYNERWTLAQRVLAAHQLTHSNRIFLFSGHIAKLHFPASPAVMRSYVIEFLPMECGRKKRTSLPDTDHKDLSCAILSLSHLTRQ